MKTGPPGTAVSDGVVTWDAPETVPVILSATENGRAAFLSFQLPVRGGR